MRKGLACQAEKYFSMSRIKSLDEMDDNELCCSISAGEFLAHKMTTNDAKELRKGGTNYED
jgi:hypothetical protein